MVREDHRTNSLDQGNAAENNIPTENISQGPVKKNTPAPLVTAPARGVRGRNMPTRPSQRLVQKLPDIKETEKISQAETSQEVNHKSNEVEQVVAQEDAVTGLQNSGLDGEIRLSDNPGNGTLKIKGSVDNHSQGKEEKELAEIEHRLVIEAGNESQENAMNSLMEI